MNIKLNATSASLTVVLYIVASLIASFLVVVLFGGVDVSPDHNERVIDGYIDRGIVALVAVLLVLLYLSLFVFKDSRRDIFFERQPFRLSKWYSVFPLTLVGVTLFALVSVNYAAYTMTEIALVLVATLAIGANEEIVTRGILLVGLRNSRVAEWVVCVVTTVAFGLLHFVNVLGGQSLAIILATVATGLLLYVSRRVSGGLIVPIILHAAYDTGFILLPGQFTVREGLPDSVLDIQLASFLILFVAGVLFLVFSKVAPHCHQPEQRSQRPDDEQHDNQHLEPAEGPKQRPH
jgi:membrane protease YdiL (CAAX protease family)